MYGIFRKLKLNYPLKLHGYHQFSSWIPRALAKFFFLQIVLHYAKYPCISRHHPQETRVSQNARNVCAITIIGTVLKMTEGIFYQRNVLFLLHPPGYKGIFKSEGKVAIGFTFTIVRGTNDHVEIAVPSPLFGGCERAIEDATNRAMTSLIDNR